MIFGKRSEIRPALLALFFPRADFEQVNFFALAVVKTNTCSRLHQLLTTTKGQYTMSTQPLPQSEPTPSLAKTSSLDLFSLKGKHALLTGATRGIGAACALALAQAGASCCLVVRPGKSAEESKKYLDALPSSTTTTQEGQQQRHCLLVTDLGDLAEVKTTFDRALQLPEMDGRIDILVNCGGIQRRHDSTEFPEEDWDEVSP